MRVQDTTGIASSHYRSQSVSIGPMTVVASKKGSSPTPESQRRPVLRGEEEEAIAEGSNSLCGYS